MKSIVTSGEHYSEAQHLRRFNETDGQSRHSSWGLVCAHTEGPLTQLKHKHAEAPGGMHRN